MPTDTFLGFNLRSAANAKAVVQEHRGEDVLVRAELSHTRGYPTLIASFAPGMQPNTDDVRSYLLLTLAGVAVRQAADKMTGAGKDVALLAAADIDRAAHAVDPSVRR